METDLTVRIGIATSGTTAPYEILYVNSDIDRSAMYKANYQIRIMLTFIEYLLLHSKQFDKAYIVFTGVVSQYPNGSLAGIIKCLNGSDVDIGFPMHIMDEKLAQFVDYTYPFEIFSHTFMTAKPKYQPETWSILQTISLPVWIAMLSSLIALTLICYAYFKPKYSFDRIMLHVWAVFLRQSSILNPSSISRKFLIFSWVVGSMFLCLAYDSVFLSFLSFPPINRVRNIAELAKKVEEGKYKCLTGEETAIFNHIMQSNDTNLKIIRKNLLLSMRSTLAKEYFIRESGRQNLAYFTAVDNANAFAWHFFVSEDHFFETMGAIMFRKNFCCGKLLDTFVHKMMASGLYFKYCTNYNYFERLALSWKYTENDNSNRKLTLTDVAPAFIFLLTGYFISILVFIGELFFKNKIKNTSTQKN